MLHYIIQTIAFQLFFIIVYDAFLKKETFFNWNRAYLLLTALLSVVLPFIKIDQFKNVVPQEYIINLPEIIIGELNKQQIGSVALDSITLNTQTFWSLQTFFYLGMLISASLLLFKLIKIVLLVFKNPKFRKGNLFIVNLLNSSAAFSFMNYVFLGEKIKPEEKASILDHEQVHVKQKHTFDLLFFEILRIVFWFNPLIYIYQNKIAALHEFIADSKASKQLDKSQYYQNLLSQVFDTNKVSFINSFYKQSLIKKRIIMLSKSKSKQLQLVKYVLLIPLVFGMLIYTSCSNEDSKVVESKSSTVLENAEALKQSILEDGEISQEELKAIQDLNMIALKKRTKVDAFENTEFDSEKEIPFGVIDNVPEHPNCENSKNNEDKKKCMSKNISLHIQEHFNTKIGKEVGLKGKQRINVIFKIDKDGKVFGIRSRAPHESLEKEAIRVIGLLPQFKPGTHNGKAVIVPYSQPIVFEVRE